MERRRWCTRKSSRKRIGSRITYVLFDSCSKSTPRPHSRYLVFRNEAMLLQLSSLLLCDIGSTRVTQRYVPCSGTTPVLRTGEAVQVDFRHQTSIGQTSAGQFKVLLWFQYRGEANLEYLQPSFQPIFSSTSKWKFVFLSMNLHCQCFELDLRPTLFYLHQVTLSFTRGINHLRARSRPLKRGPQAENYRPYLPDRLCRLLLIPCVYLACLSW